MKPRALPRARHFSGPVSSSVIGNNHGSHFPGLLALTIHKWVYGEGDSERWSLRKSKPSLSRGELALFLPSEPAHVVQEGPWNLWRTTWRPNQVSPAPAPPPPVPGGRCGVTVTHRSGRTPPLPIQITGPAASCGPSLPSLGRQRNQQIPSHQQGSQRANQHKPSGKCTNGHESACVLSLRNFISRPMRRNNPKRGAGGGQRVPRCLSHLNAKNLGRHTAEQRSFKLTEAPNALVSVFSVM